MEALLEIFFGEISRIVRRNSRGISEVILGRCSKDLSKEIVKDFPKGTYK